MRCQDYSSVNLVFPSFLQRWHVVFGPLAFKASRRMGLSQPGQQVMRWPRESRSICYLLAAVMQGLQRPDMHLSLLRSHLYIRPHSHSNFFLVRCFGGFCYIKAAMGSLAEATLALLFVYFDSIDYYYSCRGHPRFDQLGFTEDESMCSGASGFASKFPQSIGKN